MSVLRCVCAQCVCFCNEFLYQTVIWVLKRIVLVRRLCMSTQNAWEARTLDLIINATKSADSVIFQYVADPSKQTFLLGMSLNLDGAC